MPALGVKVTHALPYHPQSKPIERHFGIIEKTWVSKLPGWCRNSISERPDSFQKTLESLLTNHRLLTLEEFVAHFQNVILPEYHNTIDTDVSVPELPGWKVAVSSMTPLQKYAFLEKAKTITPDWNTISILKLHHSANHKVGRWGIRFCNTYYQADELAKIVGNTVDILFHRVQPPYAPSSITVIYQNHYLCEAVPAELRHLADDSITDIMHDTDRQNQPRQEMENDIARIRQSADAILPDKAKSKPCEKNQLFDMVYAPAVEEEQIATLAPCETSSISKESSIQKGLSFLFGED